MNTLAGLATDNTIAGEQDVVGGGWQPMPSAIQQMTIMAFYLGEADSGSKSVSVTVKNSDNKEVRQTFYVTSGRDKGQLNYYIDTQSQEKRYNPSFLMVDAMCKLSLGKSVTELSVEKKMIKLRKNGKQVEEEVDMCVEMIGQTIAVGLLHQIDDVNTKTGEKDDRGKDIYAPTGETRASNVIHKVFRSSDMMTVPEILAQKPQADFFKQWNERWEGQVNDVSKGLPGNTGAPMTGASPLTPAANQPVAASPATAAPATQDNIFNQ